LNQVKKKWTHQEIRKSFIKFFKQKGHHYLPSAKIVVQDDPSLMFINAGMNQFKGIFIGHQLPPFQRVVNYQKCLRVSGKHNDLDEVGQDSYHHTFFEMLGNWSFGDYGKKEAILWAWELLTEVWGLPKERLFVTVHSLDQETWDLWDKETNIEASHLMRFGDQDNFWEMGDVGPCGPCSEIHFDRGNLSSQKESYQHPKKGINGNNDRYLEIWNLVFIECEKRSDGKQYPLKRQYIDTGMGLERITSILQGVQSNYGTDLFLPLIQVLTEISNQHSPSTQIGAPHQVIVDHIRALAFCLADGARVSNIGAGYVLRRILRRAVRFGQKLGLNKPFLSQLISPLIKILGASYPELVEQKQYICSSILHEEEQFHKTLQQGLNRFQKIVEKAKNSGASVLDSEDVFMLHDTYGFPADLTELLASEKNLKINWKKYHALMQKQRQRARTSVKHQSFLNDEKHWVILDHENLQTLFLGYNQLAAVGHIRRYCIKGDDFFILLDKTPFYAEAGGQIADRGILKGKNFSLRVLDVFKHLDQLLHRCQPMTEGSLPVGELAEVYVEVDLQRRLAVSIHHSTTHLLHAALQNILGPHVSQQGSQVMEEKFRFDFSHDKPLTNKEKKQVENFINRVIRQNISVDTLETNKEEAIAQGAKAFFGEKYGKVVRVVKMGEVSQELCGGTHVKRTGDIGCFLILNETAVAAGIRRIEGVAGEHCIEMIHRNQLTIEQLQQRFKSSSGDLVSKIDLLITKQKEYERQIQLLEEEKIQVFCHHLIRSAPKNSKTIKILKVLHEKEFSERYLPKLLDNLSSNLQDGISVIIHNNMKTLSILVSVGKKQQTKYHASKIIKELLLPLGGKGGGQAGKARGGLKDLSKLLILTKKSKEIIGIREDV